MAEVINWLIDKVATLGEGITGLLPQSPFKGLQLAFDSKLLGYINYYVPIKEAVDILVAWGAAILLWYAYSIILRWVKAIE